MIYVFKHTLQVISRRKRNFCLTAFVIALGISLVVQTQILGTTIERNYEEILVEAYGNIRGIPTSFIINQNGEIVNRFTGYVPKSHYTTDIDRLLNSSE